MTTPTPHPLAIEAAEKISKLHQEWFYQDEEPMPDMAPIIHATALQPVIAKGNVLEAKLTQILTNSTMNHKDWIPLAEAIHEWRTLTNPQSEGSPKPSTEAPRSL
jgi:hypothetical protein